VKVVVVSRLGDRVILLTPEFPSRPVCQNTTTDRPLRLGEKIILSSLVARIISHGPDRRPTEQRSKDEYATPYPQICRRCYVQIENGDHGGEERC